MSQRSICYFGLFDSEYERNRVLISGLRQNGVDVVVCAVHGKGIRAHWQLIKSWWKIRGRYDVVIAGYSDMRLHVVLARMVFRCPVVWDAFYSLYDTYVYDRKLVSPMSVKAAYYWCMDWLCCTLADRVLLDTNAHVEYFTKTFHIRKSKFIRSFVGASDDRFHPATLPEAHQGFRVLFFGNFIPLQGIDFIVRAAKILEREGDIICDIIGSGQTYRQVRALAGDLQVSNVTFSEPRPIHELARSIARADVCLGIFGDTGKAQRVIPNKVYEAVAMAKPVITSDTPAIRELFTDRKDILLCRAAYPEDLVEKVRLLHDDAQLRSRIASGGRQTYQENCTPRIVGARLLGKLTMLK